MELFAAMGGLMLTTEMSRSQALSNRKGLQAISQLLTMDPAASVLDEWNTFERIIDELLPSHQSSLLVLLRSSDGRFQPVKREIASKADLSALKLRISDGQLVDLERRGGETISGGAQVLQWLDMFDKQHRSSLKDILTSQGLPAHFILIPVVGRDRITGLTAVSFHDVSDKRIGEWERLLKLLCALLSMRLSIREISATRSETVPDLELPKTSEELVNRLNNYLAGILGNAELLVAERNLADDTRLFVEKIIAEVESASDYIKASVGRPNSVEKKTPASPTKPIVVTRLSHLLNEELQKAHISENVYMLSGRPRELELKIDDVGEIALATETARQLLTGAIERFTSLATDDDIIVLKLYCRDDFAYLDISRHQKHFPAVEPVAGFGDYLPPADVVKRRPADTFLRLLGDSESQFSYDRFGDAPTYLSFKLPLAGRKMSAVLPKPHARILAIDDQQVILDLISAMCQSLGFEVQTASSAAEGVHLTLESSFDIILTDLAMPDMSGLEAARRIRHLHPEVPIVLVTGWEVHLSEAELEAAGVTSVLNKPFRIEQLTDVIRNALTAGSVS
jgi:CheY-like chemotaxis protein